VRMNLLLQTSRFFTSSDFCSNTRIANGLRYSWLRQKLDRPKIFARKLSKASVSGDPLKYAEELQKVA